MVALVALLALSGALGTARASDVPANPATQGAEGAAAPSATPPPSPVPNPAGPTAPPGADTPSPPAVPDTAGSEPARGSDELDVVGGTPEIRRKRAELYQQLRDQGYRKGPRKGDYQVFLSPTPWKPRVFVHDDGWVTVKRQPPRIHAPGRSFADEGNRAEYLWCIIAPTACVSIGGWVVSERKLAPQKQAVYESTRAAARELNDAVARDALGKRLNDVIPADLERIWAQPLPGEERRRLLFVYWDTRTDTPEGRAAQAVIRDFLDAVVQSSAEPFTAAELAAWNGTRSSVEALVLEGVGESGGPGAGRP
jgi:hypothetical protein